MKLIYKMKDRLKNSKGIVKQFYVFLSEVKRGAIYRNILSTIPHRLGNKNVDKKVFVISIENPNTGLAPIIIDILSYLRIAERKGYVPVIDLKYYLVLWTGTDVNVNAWEYYFIQPAGMSVNEAYQSKRVYLSSPNPWDLPEIREVYNDVLFNDKLAIKQYHKYFRKYCHYKEDLKQYIKNEMKKVLKKGRRILGCSIRMGYVLSQKANFSINNHHNIQPDNLDIFVEDLRKYLNEWKCDYIFLSTDDIGSIEYLRRSFGDKLLFLERARWIRTKDNQTIDPKTSVESVDLHSIVKINYAYLAELEILAKCQCYLCAKNGGSMLTHILNNNQFEHTHIYQLGRFEYKK